MGKRRFAGTLAAADHTTTSNKYSSNRLTAWVRGWDYGVEIVASVQAGVDCFEIYTAGGSTPGKSNGQKLVGKIVNGEFMRVQ